LCSMSIHHPNGIPVEIVGIKASGNGRSCDRHDVCGSVLGDDTVVRLRKVQIINSSGKEETAIAAYLESDGIDQCRAGFLQHYFAAHARLFDGVLAQVTEMYSITSDCSIKQKKCPYNMGCCLSALISKLPKTGTSTTTSFLKRIARQDEEEEEEDTTRLRLQRNKAIVVNYDPPSASLTAELVQQQQTTTTNVASTPPSAVRAQQHRDREQTNNDERNVTKRCSREHEENKSSSSSSD